MADQRWRPIGSLEATEIEAPCNEIPSNEVQADSRAETRKLRMASLRRIAGIWANRTDIPADGLQYERELRNEWR